MREFLQMVVGLAMMRLVMDLALPEGESRRYADLGAGLLMMLCMLRAILQLMGRAG